MGAHGAQPLRTCLGCREVRDQAALVRYVRAPDGAVLVDYRDKLPGRGAYTCLKAECIAQAVARRQFDRTFRAPCQPVSPELLRGRLVEELRDRLVALLGMARKSSQIVSGGNAVLDALAEPTRLGAVRLLWDGKEHCVCELMERLGASQSRMSRHMTLLKRAGLVVDRRDAQWVRYRRNPDLEPPLAAIVDAAVATLPKVARRRTAA